MKKQLTWQSDFYNSIESCEISAGDISICIDSNSKGSFENKLFDTTYRIETNLNWQVLSLNINAVINKTRFDFTLTSNGIGKWTIADNPLETFNGCIDVDISLTPFTNSLPINRLSLKANEEAKIKVLYVDVLEQTVVARYQKYKRLSNNEYLFQNVPNDFEAIIKVDEGGFVSDYPGLFKKV
jgi:hypothetical protein